jgi:hypothetical protein
MPGCVRELVRCLGVFPWRSTHAVCFSLTIQKLAHALDLHEQRGERPLMGLRVHGHGLVRRRREGHSHRLMKAVSCSMAAARQDTALKA